MIHRHAEIIAGPGYAMIRMSDKPIDRSLIEDLLAENKWAEARALLHQAGPQTVAREVTLYRLLVDVRLHGPERCEHRIDALRRLTGLTEHEKSIVQRIFLHGFQMAEKAGQEDKKRAYQRLLRRLLLGQPLSEPIPITPKPLTRRRVIVLEPAAIVSTGAQARPRVSSMMDMMPSLAVGYCAACILAAPLAYLAATMGPAKTQSVAVSGQSARVAASAETGAASAEIRISGERQGLHRFDEAQIKTGLAGQLKELRRAYASWITKRPNMAGKVSLKLTLDGQGKVVGVSEVSSELREAGFIKTVIGEARKWRFPIARAEASEITIPLLFIPHGAGATRHTTATTRHDFAEPAASLNLDYVTRRAVALRAQPRFASVTLEEIPLGTRLRVIAAEGDWFKVVTMRFPGAGFVRKEFVFPAAFGQ